MSLMTDNTRGAILITGSMAAFSLNDAMMKLVFAEVGLFQAILVRGVAASVLLGLLAWHRGALAFRPDRRNARVIVIRTVGEVGATMTFLLALFNMPLANATSILQSAPLFITLAAVVFLREPVGWRRALATGVGFMGVMLIIRPGTTGFNSYALVALASVGFIVLRDVVTRRLSTDVPSLLVAFATALSVTVAGGIGCLLGDWVPIPGVQIATLWGAALFLLSGYVFSVMAMRVGEISFVTPFRYFVLLFALILGYLFFDELPDVWTLLGCAIIVAMGVFTFYRERKVAAVAS